jgi:catechol 2,3-dioxygenase-like lactoylglutathione lyase family enzyme
LRGIADAESFFLGDSTMKLSGLDHADIRVPSLAQVERFYDAVLPVLGLSRKAESHVGFDGEWHAVDATRTRNAIEYHTPLEPGLRGWFVGFIEDREMHPTRTRIAFALDSEAELDVVEAIVRAGGGCVIEWSSDAGYPALFFEDPAGTRLEICARRPRG